MKNLTLKKLESLTPCESGLVWFKNQKEKDVYKICIALINVDILITKIFWFARTVRALFVGAKS